MNKKINTEELADIRSVSVDRTLTKTERIIAYVRQIRNPYLFKCGKFTVSTKFDKNGPTFEECLFRIIT